MSTLRSRYAALAGVASLMLGASIATAGAASAVVPHYGEHGADVTAVTAYNNADVLAVTSGAYDAPVVAGAAGSASEFVVRKSGDVIVLEYAPFGFAGTPALCVSDPGPGYGAADVIELRDCNGSIFQQFTEFSDGNGYVSLRDNATHQFITDEGQGVGVAGIKDGVVGEPGNNSPSFAADQLWKVGAARAYVAPQPARLSGVQPAPRRAAGERAHRGTSATAGLAAVTTRDVPLRSPRRLGVAHRFGHLGIAPYYIVPGDVLTATQLVNRPGHGHSPGEQRDFHGGGLTHGHRDLRDLLGPLLSRSSLTPSPPSRRQTLTATAAVTATWT